MGCHSADESSVNRTLSTILVVSSPRAVPVPVPVPDLVASRRYTYGQCLGRLAYDSAFSVPNDPRTTVTDPITTSKSARESLARGLNALQADPSVPPQLVELAAPIAQAMGALHQIERTQQLAPHADVALNHVRGALAQLQAAHANHPAVTQALEAVATSLSLVHSLSRMANGPAPAAAQQQQQPQQQQQRPQPQPQPAPQQAMPQPQPQPAAGRSR